LSSSGWPSRGRWLSTGRKSTGSFSSTRDKTVYINHYYFYIDDAGFGPLFLKVLHS
jgi:hypothetical protein